MELSEYIEANQPKGRRTKKYLREHNKALHAAWYHIYIQMPKIVLNQAKDILNM